METFQLEILAADRPFYKGPCQSMRVPISDGQYGILAHHRDVIAALVPGTLHLCLPDGTEQIAAVSQGLIKVENNHVLILADTIERPEEIDANRARREAEEAREAMLQKQSVQSYHSAQARMARALNRLKVKEQQMINN